MVSLFHRKNTLKVLIVEDNEDDALLLSRHLQRNGFSVQHQRVDTMTALEQALRQPWDVVLADYSMPTMSGMDALMKVRASNLDIPFIFVSGTIGEERAVEAIRMGAQDYVLKDKLNRLPAVIRREIQDARARKEHRSAEQQMNYLARYDGVTGLPTRHTLLEHLKTLINTYNSDKRIILVLYIRFAQLNSTHEVLDYNTEVQYLLEISNRLQFFIQDQGLIARLSTHEFALIHTGFTAEDPIESTVENLADTLSKPYCLDTMPVYCSVRIGVAVYPGGAFDAQDMLRKAEVAANSIEPNTGSAFYSANMSRLIENRLALQRSLYDSLAKREFILTFQPQVDMKTGEIVSAEAIIEWHNSERGIITSDVFLPLAEESGFIFLLGEWAVRQICHQLKLWEYSGISTPCIAVTITGRQLQEENLLDMLKQLLEEHDLSPNSLRLEITEAAIMQNSEKAAIALREIKQAGIKVALENFGSSHSNLAYLKDFVSDFITIGANFLRGDIDTAADRIAMAHKLGLQTIAKGIDTAAQYAALRNAGCDLAQGNFISGILEPWMMREKLRSAPGHITK